MSVARRVIAGGAVVAVVGVGFAAYAASADGTSYRTATATTGDVEQTLELSGVVEPAGRADLAFATSGTIEDIAVEAGEKVTSGEVLGTLDDTSLRTSVQQARATLAAARAQLESDENAQSDTVSAASTTSSTTASITPSTTPSTAPTPVTPQETPAAESPDAPSPDAPDPVLGELADQQAAVTTAQSTVSASLAAARDALTAQQTACAAAFTPDDEPSTDPSADPSADPETSGDETDQACTDALAAVQTAQQQVATDQDALQTALDTLSATLSTATAGLSEEPDDDTAGPQASAAPTEATPQTGGSSASSDTGAAMGSSGSVTAAGLARDQAAIDQAEADLLIAQQQLRMATVTAPFAGEIVAVDAAVGDSVSSGTEVFVLVSRGTSTVQVDATSTQVEQLAVGQQVTVVPAGSERELAGSVSQISTVPDDSSTYPVTITLERKHLDIATGLNASVAVVTGTASDVVTVPSSAVTDGTVTVKSGDTVTRTRVSTGVVGTTTVEIVDGIAAGDVVVLADLDRALPTADDSNQIGGFGAGGTGGPPAGVGPGGFAR